MRVHVRQLYKDLKDLLLWFGELDWLMRFVVIAAVIGGIFVILGVGFAFFGDRSIGDRGFLTGAGSMFTAAGLLYVFRQDRLSKSTKASEFYLSQIKEYFKAAMDLISFNDNTNIKWNHSRYLLKQATELSQYLNESEHKRIYAAEYMKTAYNMIDVFNKISSCKFFYGVPDYESRDADVLFRESASWNIVNEQRTRAVSIETLEYMKCFLARATKYNQDVNHRKLDLSTCINLYLLKQITAEEINSMKKDPSWYGGWYGIKAIDEYVCGLYKQMNKSMREIKKIEKALEPPKEGFKRIRSRNSYVL